MNGGTGGFGRRKFVAGSAGLLAAAESVLSQQSQYSDGNFAGVPIPGSHFVAGDIRFTTKGDSLYAIVLAWPEDRKLMIRSLAWDSPYYRGAIARVGLLGSESNLTWSRGAEGVTINLPDKPPCDYAYVLKINPLGA